MDGGNYVRARRSPRTGATQRTTHRLTAILVGGALAIAAIVSTTSSSIRRVDVTPAVDDGRVVFPPVVWQLQPPYWVD